MKKNHTPNKKAPKRNNPLQNEARQSPERHKRALASCVLLACLCSFFLSSCMGFSLGEETDIHTTSYTPSLFDDNNLSDLIECIDAEVQTQGVSAQYLLPHFVEKIVNDETKRIYPLSDAVLLQFYYDCIYPMDESITLWVNRVTAIPDDQSAFSHYAKALLTLFEPDETRQEELISFLHQEETFERWLRGTNCVFEVRQTDSITLLAIHPLSLPDAPQASEETAAVTYSKDELLFAGMPYQIFIERLNAQLQERNVPDAFSYDNHYTAPDDNACYMYRDGLDSTLSLFFDSKTDGNQNLQLYGNYTENTLSENQITYCASIFATLEPNHKMGETQFMDRLLSLEQTDHFQSIYYGTTGTYLAMYFDTHFILLAFPY